jgi:fumarate reductase flavoprotein subunit
VFGARAGRAAAEYASRAAEIHPRVTAQKTDEHRRLEQELFGRKGRERIATLRDEMQKTMEASAGIYREASSIRQGIAELQRLQERYADIVIEDHSRTFNTERVAALELSFLLDIAPTMLAAALAREESRGAHQRRDFAKRDDQRFLAHALVSRNADGSCRLEQLPVTITRWPPAERVYGEAAPHVKPDNASDRPLSPGAGV